MGGTARNTKFYSNSLMTSPDFGYTTLDKTVFGAKEKHRASGEHGIF